MIETNSLFFWFCFIGFFRDIPINFHYISIVPSVNTTHYLQEAASLKLLSGSTILLGQHQQLFHLSLPAKWSADMLILTAEFRSYHWKPTPQTLTGLFRIIKALGMESLPLQKWAYFSFPLSNVFNTGPTWASYIFPFPFSSFALHHCCHAVQKQWCKHSSQVSSMRFLQLDFEA